ncbi:hypothetical protein ACFE04_030115 [Oxalis oulophora]
MAMVSLLLLTPNAQPVSSRSIIPSLYATVLSSTSTLTPPSTLFSPFCRISSRNLMIETMAIAQPRTVSAPNIVSQSPAVYGNSKQALISLSDKKNLELLAKGLQHLGYNIISTGGTASSLQNAGVSVTKVEHLTTFPEMKVTSSGGTEFDDGVENIDIGGPAMIRAAAKNHKDVLVVVDSEDYPALLEFLKGNLEDQQFRRKLAWKAFQHVASYDSAVSEWLWKQTVGDIFPPSLTVLLSLKSSLRYGENPHQKAAFYVDRSLAEVNAGGIATAVQHHGKEMSYNNYLDADAAWNCVSEFKKPTCVIVKHTNPCGVASRNDIVEAYRLAVKADPVSAFGGIVAFNMEVDEALAEDIREFRSPIDGETKTFYEIVIAPKYTKKGLEILCGKSKNLRILEAKKNEKGKLSLRQVGGGWLAQDSDDLTPEDIKFTVVTEKHPQESELHDAEFAWLCVKHIKSNAIDNCMLGMGSGQPNRVESLRIALRKAGDKVKGAALASDAFFPFAWKDAVEDACQSGVSVIAEPGGSIRDKDAIDCCNKYGVSLLFTNVRHFRH